MKCVESHFALRRLLNLTPFHQKRENFYEKMFEVEPFPTVESTINSAKLKIVLFELSEVEIELIQVLEKESIPSRFLKERGEELHQLGFFVKHIEKSWLD